MTAILPERPGPVAGVGDGRPASSAGFLSAYPGYQSTALLDRLRTTEYSYLDAGGRVYLDYGGAGPSAQAQLAAHAERIRGRCFGNPHSENPASAASTELIERARRAVLAHFNAPPEEYAAIFTPNATGACRLVAEAYPFGPRTRLVLTADNHNSVSGIREFARSRGAATRYVPFSSPDLRVDDDAIRQALARPRPGTFAVEVTGRLHRKLAALARHRTRYPVAPETLPQSMLGTEFFRRAVGASPNGPASRCAKAPRPRRPAGPPSPRHLRRHRDATPKGTVSVRRP